MQGDPVEIFLQPGEFFVGDANHEVRTLLGSCVSITLWHRARRVGAMSHFLLASRGPVSPDERDGRYGEEALSLMVDRLRRAGVNIAECEAKIFGGGDMFPGSYGRGASGANIGLHNGEAARRLVCDLGIPVISENLFGVGHRQIVFRIATGDVWVRQVAPVETKSKLYT